MSQSNILLAFRARLRSHGYTEIKIKRCLDYNGNITYSGNGEELYNVRCTEPLLGFDVFFTATESEMANWPGIEFSRYGYFERQMEFDMNGGIFV